jgi:hypothetical protein
MPEDRFIAKSCWIAAAVLAALGAVLWFAVPIRPMFPPYLATALLVSGYGTYCGRKARPSANRPKS